MNNPNLLPRQVNRSLLISIALLALSAMAQVTQSAEPDSHTGQSARRMNVLFLIADDLTANALGGYHNADVKTPNLDRLASQSMVFDRAYCQYPVCGPARATLMSGLYPQTIQVVGNGSADRFTKRMEELGHVSMSEYFKNRGWKTARVSKIYHMRVPGDITAGVDGPDHFPSWDERFNCQAPEWMSLGPWEHLSNERLNKDPDKHYGLGFGTAFYSIPVPGKGMDQADYLAAERAVDWLKKNGKDPFFLAVGFVRPHVPLVAPGAFYDLHPAEKMTLPDRVQDDWEDLPEAAISKNSKGIGVDGDLEKQRRILSAYYASVAFMDQQLGRVLDELDRQGLRDNTIVVFTSDHGYHLGEHDFWQKMSLHDESARVPLLIDAPGYHGKRVRSLAESIDLYPTLVDLMGMEVPEICQGVSLKPAMDAPGSDVRDYIYTFRGNAHLIRNDRWAYIRYERQGGGEELYDMDADPGQFRNLAEETKAGMPQILEQMRSILEKHLASL